MIQICDLFVKADTALLQAKHILQSLVTLFDELLCAIASDKPATHADVNALVRNGCLFKFTRYRCHANDRSGACCGAICLVSLALRVCARVCMCV